MVDIATGGVVGANLPWITYGCDFGANAWQPHGGLAHRGVPDATRRLVESAVAGGLNVLRWFLLCDGRAGLHTDGNQVVGPDDALFADIDAALEFAAALDVQVVFAVFDFHWCLPTQVVNGVQTGGRRRLFTDPHQRRMLIDRVVGPLFARFGSHRGIAAWDLINEPEWVTCGYGAVNPFTSVIGSTMRAFLADVVACARPLVRQPLTVGLASANWLSLVEGLDLDFYQVHWYDHVDAGCLPRPVRDLGLSRPIVIGEFPTAGSAHAADALVEHAAAMGYAGAWLWSLTATDGATDRAAGAAAILAEHRACRSRIDGTDRRAPKEDLG